MKKVAFFAYFKKKKEIDEFFGSSRSHECITHSFAFALQVD